MSEGEQKEFEYEVDEKYALVSHGNMPVALLPDMESAREFVKRSERYSLDVPPGGRVTSIQYPVHVVKEVEPDA